MYTLFARRRGLFAAAAAIAAIAAVPARGVETNDLVATVQKLVDGLLQVMKAGAGTPFVQRLDMLSPVIEECFDFATILQASIGPAWATLPQDQQQMLIQAFRRYTVSSYVNNFNSYNGQQIRVLSPPTPVGNGEMIVKTEIIPTSGDRHELDYVMRQGHDGWRIVDVLADGAISQVAVQRSDFRRLLAQGGAPALAESLRRKSADLSDGQASNGRQQGKIPPVPG